MIRAFVRLFRLSRALPALLVLVLACGGASAACAPNPFDGARFTVCAFHPARDDIRLFWKSADGQPFGSLHAVSEQVGASGRRLVFAMNAGMFAEDFSPVGLYIEGGRKLHPADTKSGESNFRMKPNGIFWVGVGRAGVTETGRYLANPPPALYATQSGPMLLIDGRIHPKILPTGASQKIRNGVGVRDDGEVVFAISDQAVNFDTFARLFRDGLGCRNALFLDGSVSSLYAPELGRDDGLAPIGPIVGVLAPAAK